jgi:uncharacterized damage-inducible protein DinB
MNPLHNLRMLTRYTVWADEKLFAALQALPEGVPAAKGTGFGSMIHTLNHSLVVDLIWRAHLETKTHGFTTRNTETLPTLAGLRAAQAEQDAWFVTYADALTPATHDEMIHFNFVDGGPGEMTRGEMLLHVINHKTYHRGFVSEMIFQLPVKAPMMDLPVFLRDAPAHLTLRDRIAA